MLCARSVIDIGIRNLPALGLRNLMGGSELNSDLFIMEFASDLRGKSCDSGEGQSETAETIPLP